MQRLADGDDTPNTVAMSRFDAAGEYQIGRDRFVWVVKHYAGEFSADTNFRGVSARVSLAGEKCRELIIDFDPKDYPAKRPTVSHAFQARLMEYTQKAMDEGWKPDSRGKPYRILADKLKP